MDPAVERGQDPVGGLIYQSTYLGGVQGVEETWQSKGVFLEEASGAATHSGGVSRWVREELWTRDGHVMRRGCTPVH